jgi:hypothetical protein
MINYTLMNSIYLVQVNSSQQIARVMPQKKSIGNNIEKQEKVKIEPTFAVFNKNQNYRDLKKKN